MIWPIGVITSARQDGAWADLTLPWAWDLPLLAAHGLVDSIEIARARHLPRDGRAARADGQAARRSCAIRRMGRCAVGSGDLLPAVGVRAAHSALGGERFG